MSKKNSNTALILIGVSLFLVAFSMFNFCGTCDWWNVFCHAGNFACNTVMAPVRIGMLIMAGIMFLVGCIKLIRRK